MSVGTMLAFTPMASQYPATISASWRYWVKPAVGNANSLMEKPVGIAGVRQ